MSAALAVPSMHAAAVALWCASLSAQAVIVDPSGRGQVLLLPYYTVQGGQQTLLSIVNDGNTGTALKLRFREGRNGREVLSLNLYLAEFDVWTGAVYAEGPGRAARLLSHDRSCSVPALATEPGLPAGARVASFGIEDFSGIRADGGPTRLERTREGYVEIIEMGALVNGSDSDKAATHVVGVPQNCPALDAAWAPGGYWQIDPSTDLLPPSGKLSASASIVDPLQGTLYPMPATALSRFSIVPQHAAPGSRQPDLSSAVTDPARRVVESIVWSDGRLLRSEWPQERAIDAVTAVLAQATIGSQFLLDPGLDARTELLLSFPTKRFYTDGALTADQALPPFGGVYGAMQNGQPHCERYNVAKYNREEARPTGEFSFGAPVPHDYCHATLPLTLDHRMRPGSLLQSELARRTTLFPEGNLLPAAGHLEISVTGISITRPALGGERYRGLPAIGFRAYRFRDGATRTYSGTATLNGTVECGRDGLACSGE